MRLDEALASEEGTLAERAFTLDYMLSKHIGVSAAEIPADVFRALQLVDEERDKLREEREREREREQQSR